jgi:CoA:oxalate CoA-transferase
MVQEVEHPVVGKLKIPGIPIKLSETPGSIQQPAPLLGEHTEIVLRDVFGYTPSEIDTFRMQGIFGQESNQ